MAKEGTDATAADMFARAFSGAQETVAARGRLGIIWPFQELTHDKTGEYMKVVDSFVNPILQDAIANHKKDKEAGLKTDADVEEVGDDETFLENLVRRTSG